MPAAEAEPVVEDAPEEPVSDEAPAEIAEPVAEAEPEAEEPSPGGSRPGRGSGRGRAVRRGAKLARVSSAPIRTLHGVRSKGAAVRARSLRSPRREGWSKGEARARAEGSTRATACRASSGRLPSAVSHERFGTRSGSSSPSLGSTLVRTEMAESKGGNSKGNRPNRPVRPRQAPGGRKRRVVIDSGAARPRQDSRQARGRAEPRPKSQPGPQPTGPVTVPSGVIRQETYPQALGVPAAQIIKIMMGLGEMGDDPRSRSPTRPSS